MIWGSCVICETVTSLIYYSWVFNLWWSFYPLIPWFPFLDSFVLPWIFYFSLTFRMCSNSNNLDQLHVIIPDFFLSMIYVLNWEVWIFGFNIGIIKYYFVVILTDFGYDLSDCSLSLYESYFISFLLHSCIR